MKFEKLGNIADIIAGQSPPSSTYNSEGNGLPFFQGKADYGEKYPTVRYWCTEPTKISLPDDILISMRAPVGPVNINTVESCIGRGLSAIRVKKNVSRDFIYFWLKQNQHIIAAKQTGSTFKAITQKILSEIVVPFPDYSNQLHIASILSKAENLIAQRKESIRLLDEFLKSTFLEMFGDPVRNEKGWETKPLGELCNIRRGASPRPINNFIGDEVPWIKIGDGTKGNDLYIESTQVSITKEGASKSVLLDEGSLVFANCGVSLGFARILKIKGCIHDGWLSFENIKSELDKIYLLKLLNNSTEYLRRIAPDGTQPNLNTGIMKNFKIILPPIKLQTQFAQIVEKTEALKSQYQQSLQELDNLYGSLSQKAFRGELTINKAVSV